MRNVNLLFKKGFKSAKLLTKTAFSIYFRDRPKNGMKCMKLNGNISTERAKVVFLVWENYYFIAVKCSY